MKLLTLLLILTKYISLGCPLERFNIKKYVEKVSNDSIDNNKFENRINIDKIHKSSAEIDIRLCVHHSLTNTKTLHRLYKVGEKWFAIKYVEWNNPVKIKNIN